MRRNKRDNRIRVTADDLLAGAKAEFEVVIPPHILRPVDVDGTEDSLEAMAVELRPLTIGTFQLIMKAARDDAGLIPLLMIKEALVEPSLSLEQVKQLHLGLVQFLIAHIREISGLTEKKSLMA